MHKIAKIAAKAKTAITPITIPVTATKQKCSKLLSKKVNNHWEIMKRKVDSKVQQVLSLRKLSGHTVYPTTKKTVGSIYDKFNNEVRTNSDHDF